MIEALSLPAALPDGWDSLGLTLTVCAALAALLAAASTG